MRGSFGWLVVITVALTACGTADKSVAGTVRDSSGVSMIDHPAGALETAPRYGIGEPVHTVGGAAVDSLHNMSAMRNAVFTGGGRFVALDGRANRLVLFDSTGAVLATYGRRTTGLDSMRAPSQPRLAPDGSVWLVDLPARIIRVTADLKPISQITVGPKDPVLATILLLVGNNAVAFENDVEQPKVADAAIHRGTQYLIDLKANFADTLTSWPGSEWYAQSTTEGGEKMVTTQPVRFGKNTIVRSWTDKIVVGTGDSWRLDVRDSSGKLVKAIVLHEPRRAVTEALRDTVKARDLRQIAAMQGADEQMKATVRASLDQERFADSVAPYDDAVEGRDSTLWVSEVALPTDSVRWYAVFNKDGHLTRRVELPARERLLAADGDLILVRRMDAANVAYFDLVRVKRAK